MNLPATAADRHRVFAQPGALSPPDRRAAVHPPHEGEGEDCYSRIAELIWVTTSSGPMPKGITRAKRPLGFIR